MIDRSIYNWCVACSMSYSPEAEVCPRCKLSPEDQQRKAEMRRKAMDGILDRAWKKEGP